MTWTSVLTVPDVIDGAPVDPATSASPETVTAAQNLARPTQSFLRWAGGKRWLLHHLPAILGSFEISGYHEPFLGGGAVFFGSTITGQVHLSDLNADLIETYIQVRDHVERVANVLETHVNTSEHYYAVRASSPADPASRAAKFIYLNHTSYNGIYRVNLNGQYNVPFGRPTNVNLPSPELLDSVSRKLQGVTVCVSDFQDTAERVREGDLIFLDPPYTVAHNNNGFIKYNQRLFSFEDQARLSVLIDAMRERGAYYLMTNAAHESIAALFEKGDRMLELSRGNSIGGRKAARGSAAEYIFTNMRADE